MCVLVLSQHTVLYSANETGADWEGQNLSNFFADPCRHKLILLSLRLTTSILYTPCTTRRSGGN